MSINKFKKLVKHMIKTYGVHSYLETADDDPWFECPDCEEPVYFDDWEDDEELETGHCPICGCILEV